MLVLPRKHSNRRFTHRLAFALMAWLAIMPAEELPEQTHHVTGVRFWTLGDVTRIAIETDGDFRFRTNHLENPDRLFFDLIGTKPTMSEQKGTTTIPVMDHLVRQIRVAENQHNVTRVVLDMASDAEISTSRLDNPDRLIIELRSSIGASAKSTAPKLPVDGEAVVPKPDPPKIELTAAKTPLPLRTFNPPAPTARADKYAMQPATLSQPPLIVESQSTSPSLAASITPRIMTLPPRPAPPVMAKPAATLASNTLPAPSTFPTAASEPGLPAKRNATGDRSMIRVLGLKVGRIVLDPGHGGHDTGTTGPEGLKEKDLVLDVAKRLGALIESRLGSEVIYTRTDDTFIPLERRTEIANEAKADLFLSIHANSSPLVSAAGVETYYLNFTTSKQALEVAARENSGSQKTVFELQDLLEKIALKDKVEESREFASRIQSAVFAVTAKSDSHARDRGIKKAPFVVLIGASMPSVLSEIGFISNAHEESIMKKPEYRERLAEALYKGLSSYASTLSHFQVAQRH